MAATRATAAATRMPVAIEQIAVRDSEADWEGAAERLLIS